METDQNKVYIVGNWKMNPATEDDADTLFDEVENDVYKLTGDAVEVVVCPPCLFLPQFDPEGKVRLGAQNVFWEERGAYTGEVSVEMLRRFGVKYVIVGHSERRCNLGETDEMVNFKVRACLAGRVRPILCVGETLEDRQGGHADEVIVGQLDNALRELSESEIAGKLIIAYEPVWAIGSGAVPTTDEVMGVGLLIKKVLSRIFLSRQIADEVPLLYGGSVNPQNCRDLVEKTGMNGLLVGTASLKAGDFMGIVKEFGK